MSQTADIVICGAGITGTVAHFLSKAGFKNILLLDKHPPLSFTSPEGFSDSPGGADLLIGNELIRKHFPYLTERSVAALHVRCAGWLSAQQLGMYLLETGRRRGVRFESA